MTTINTIEDFLRIVRENPEWAREVRAVVLTDELLALPEVLAKFVTAVEQQFETVRQQFETINRRIDVLERILQRHEDDIGDLKGVIASRALQIEYDFIVEDMGFRPVRILDRNEIRELAQSQPFVGIPRDQRRSFRRADMIVEVVDDDDATHFITIETSYTLDERDTDRARRNARFMTQFTGHPAHPAVTGRRVDDRIRGIIASGAVFYHQLDDEYFRAD